MPTHFRKGTSSENPHIMFVYPPGFGMVTGTAYIIGYLRQQGFTARQFLAEKSLSVPECVRQITAGKPKVVGFTVYHTNYCTCQLLARGIKEVNPGIIIVFGGPTATVQAEKVLKNNPWVDICVRNEGEETCLELLTLLDHWNYDLKQAAAHFDKIKGISYRAEKEVLENPSRDVFFNNRHIPDYLDKYPSPYLSGVVNSSGLGVITARGCNRHCVYCHCSVLSKRVIVTHSIDRVLAELSYLAGQTPRPPVVDIFDDAFTLLPERALQICKQIIANKINLPLICATRCDLIDEEFLDCLKAAGFKAVSFSLESAVPRILRILGKVQPPNTTADDNFEKEKEFIRRFKKYVVYAKKIGIEIIYTSIMLGLPGETPQEARQTVELIRSLGKYIDMYAHNVLQVYPETPVYHNCQDYGLTLLKYDNQVHYGVVHPFDTSKIDPAPNSSAELENIARDRVNMKIMALSVSPDREIHFRYFYRIILCSDKITRDLILWLQEYLAVDGEFIQVYSGIESARQYYRENDHALYKYISPTMNYTGYYQTQKEDGRVTWSPLRWFSLGKKCGISIEWVNTAVGVSADNPAFQPRQTICIDREKQDVFQLQRCLADLGAGGATLIDLLDRPTFPYFSSLCRWEKGTANCQLLHTLIVDADNNVKTCWNGEPIGKVGMLLPGIAANLKQRRRGIEKRRGCKDCDQQAGCSKCIFTAPLSGEEYCDLKKGADTEKGAELIRSLELFKEE